MISLPADRHLQIGGLIFPGLDQLDFTGPFEILSRLPDSTFHILAQSLTPVRDMKGLLLTPEKTLADAPDLDVLLVPGGAGQVDLMEDAEFLGFLRRQAENAQIVFSVCTGALLLGAAGLLDGVKCTTHWASFEFLDQLGATPINQHVVIDGKFISAAGVSSGLDGALRVAALLRGENVARQIQLYMHYAPEPPFDGGTPETAPKEILIAARESGCELAERRRAVVQRIVARRQRV